MTDRETRTKLANLLEEKSASLQKLRGSTGETISALNAVSIVLSRLEVKYEAVTQQTSRLNMDCLRMALLRMILMKCRREKKLNP